MKISVLTPDLSHNCLGRAYLLAKILQRRYDVEIVGPEFGNGVWEPVSGDTSIAFKSVKVSGRFSPYWQLKDLLGKIEGDVIYASKPLFTSFGIALVKKFLGIRPLILDIDDWQMGFMKADYENLSAFRFVRWLAASAVYFYRMDSFWSNFFGEKLFRLSDEITVSNGFLRRKFGGKIVWHARDTDFFNPEKFDKNLMRQKYQISPSKKVVMFLGTMREQKGIEDLIKAVSLVKDKNVFLVIVGVNYKSRYCLNLIRSARNNLTDDRFASFGLQPFKKIPEFLKMADVVVIPQRRRLSTVGQVPARVFDAMAMAKPIIATDVSSLPEVIAGCGWIVEPGNAKQLAAAIRYAFDNFAEAESRGQNARRRCIDRYSWKAAEKTLSEIFGKYE